MTKLTLFDLDHTLLPIDSDYEWGQFMVRIGAVDPVEFKRRNAEFYAQYQAGTLDPVEYLEFAFGTLAQFPARAARRAGTAQFMDEVIAPALQPSALDLVRRHHDAGDLVAIITATNRFVTAPIAAAFGVEHLIAAEPEVDDARQHHRQVARHAALRAPARWSTCTHGWRRAASRWTVSSAATFYSDSQNDIPLLSGRHPPGGDQPNALLDAHAKAHGWPILNLFND